MPRLALASALLLLTGAAAAEAAAPARPAGVRPQIDPLALCRDIAETSWTTTGGRFVFVTGRCQGSLSGAAPELTSVRKHNCSAAVRNDRGRLVCATTSSTRSNSAATPQGSWRTSCRHGELYGPVEGASFTYARCPSPTGWTESGMRAASCPGGRLKNDRGVLACE